MAPFSAATFGLIPRHEPPVACDHDLALDVDAALRQLLVVRGHAVVDVDELAGHVAVDRVGVVGRQLLARLARRRVLRERRLGERGAERSRREHLDQAHLRGREQHVEGLDARVVAPGAEEPGHPLGVVLAVGRAQVVRALREPLDPVADVAAAHAGVEALLERALLHGGLGGEAEQRGLHGRRGRGQTGDD